MKLSRYLEAGTSEMVRFRLCCGACATVFELPSTEICVVSPSSCCRTLAEKMEGETSGGSFCRDVECCLSLDAVGLGRTEVSVRRKSN